jgi:two-component system, NarL family, nitrate/nitrite response regulator NarL
MENHYLFISPKGEMLPRWKEAFPTARCSASHAGAGSPLLPAILWLRLDQTGTVADQMARSRALFGHAPMVVLSDLPDDEQALAAFAAAAKGYGNAHASTELLHQIESVVLLGGLWTGETLIQRLLGALGNVRLTLSPPSDWKAALTERECEVTLAVCSGASNKEVARQLGITERTVKAHVGATFEKLKVRDRLQLALLVRGLAQPGGD